MKGWYHVDDDISITAAARVCGRKPLERLPVHLHLDLDGPRHFGALANRFGGDVTIGEAIRNLIEECER